MPAGEVGEELHPRETCQNFPMMGRRSAALLCVLLAHALLIAVPIHYHPADPVRLAGDEFESEPITLYLPPPPEEAAPAAPVSPRARAISRRAPTPAAATLPAAAAAGVSGAIRSTDQVDWPAEGKKAAARVL